VALVLLVACTNLANLMLARGSVRRQEVAVRRALGASRSRLVREQMAESVLLAIAGGLVAVAIARLILVLAAQQIAPGVQFHLETDLAPGVLLAGAVAVGLTVLVFGFWPALQLTRQDPRAALVGDTGTGAIRWRSRRNLIVGQVAISAGFLLFAALCVTAVRRETQHEAGIVDIDRLATARFNVRGLGWDDARSRRAVERVLELASAQPGVDTAAVTSGFPVGFTWDATLSAGGAVADRGDLPKASFISATPAIFQVLGLPIVDGRAFDARDAPEAPRVAVISESAARAAFGTTRIVGRHLAIQVLDSSTTTTKPEIVSVIGIVADAPTGGRMRKRSAIYVPLAQRSMPSVEVVVRTPGDPDHLLVPLRTIVRQADPDLFAERSVTGVYRLDPARWALGGFGDIATLLGLVVLVLAMTGLSGVMTHLVARRTRELGVRMALGASRAGIAKLVLGDGIRPVAMGLAFGIPVGLVGWLAFSPVARLPTSVIDLPILSLVPAVLIGAAMVACYLPARRAANVDPNVALKSE
jgi:predicted permease